MCDVIEAFGQRAPVRIIECGQMCSNYWSVQALRRLLRESVWERQMPRKFDKQMYYWPELKTWRDIAPSVRDPITVPNSALLRQTNPVEYPYPELLPKPVPKPEVVPNFPDHPTLLEIAERQREIDAQDAAVNGGNRFLRMGGFATGLWAVSCLLGGLIAGSLLLALGAIPLMAVCVFIFYCVRIPSPNRPEPLKLVPFSDKENKYLLGRQDEEPFRAYPACPGCGDVAAHLIREPATGEPEWAKVIRVCQTCKREWAQI